MMLTVSNAACSRARTLPGECGNSSQTKAATESRYSISIFSRSHRGKYRKHSRVMALTSNCVNSSSHSTTTVALFCARTVVIVS